MNKTQDPAGTAASYGPGEAAICVECRSHEQCMNRMNRMNYHIERRGYDIQLNLAAGSGLFSQSKINDSSKDSFCELAEGSFPVVLFFACYLSWVGKADHPKEAMLEVSRKGLADSWGHFENLWTAQLDSLRLIECARGEWASPRPFGRHNSDILVSWRGIV